jgi:hypothetical protein
MAYITAHNLQKIVRRNNLKDISLSGEIYKNKIYLFSKYEEASLLAIKELMKNPEKYLKDVYNPINVVDSKKYIYKEHQPAYHQKKECERLNSDFTNFALPIEIIQKGDIEIERFRNWFLINRNLLQTKPDLFVAKLQLMFGIIYSPKSVRYENSGFDDFKNYTIQEIENKIDSLLKEAGRYYYASEKNTIILKAYQKVSGRAFIENEYEFNITGYSSQEIRDFLKEYHNKFKHPIKSLLVEYYRIKLNPELQFTESLLDALGFRKCSNCYEHRAINDVSVNGGNWLEINSILNSWEEDH